MSENFEKGERYDSTRQAWEDIWDGASVAIEVESFQYPRAQKMTALYLPYLSKDEVILEAGSGLGAALINFQQMGYRIIGLDYALNALQACQAYDETLALVGGDVHYLPYAENSIGAYLSYGVLEHFEHGMEPALKEAYRVLRPGGILVMTIPYPNIVNRLVAWKRRLTGKSLLNDEEFFESTYNKTQMREHLEAVGFEIIDIHPTGHSFTLWTLGGMFRSEGYYRTNKLARGLGGILEKILPWPFTFETLSIAKKPESK